jgi:hypothetical protein
MLDALAPRSSAAGGGEFGLDDRGYVPLEAEATLVRQFQASARRHSDEKIETAVRVRRIRQERLLDEDDPLELVAIIDEFVLHRSVRGREVLRAQLERLVSAAELPTVTFQVLPLASCVHLGLDGPFSVLSFGELGAPDLAYVEYLNGAVHMEKEEDVTRASIVFGRLRSGALSPADSVPLVERTVAEMSV